MRRERVRLAALLWTVGVVACAQDEGVPLEDGHPLSVAGDPIPLPFVARVATRQGLAPLAAARALSRDAMLASAFEARSPDEARYLTRIGLARRMSERFIEDARAQGAPTDEEVRRFTQLHFFELDRPELSRTTHAVVLTDAATDRAAAVALAERIRAAVLSCSDKDCFRERAESVPSGDLKIKVEELTPVAVDGRVIDPSKPPAAGAPSRRFAEPFAKAAAALDHVGEISPLVESSFGFHVIQLNERIAAVRVPFDERRALLSDEIYGSRARTMMEAVLSDARSTLPIRVESAALALTEGLTVGR